MRPWEYCLKEKLTEILNSKAPYLKIEHDIWKSNTRHGMNKFYSTRKRTVENKSFNDIAKGSFRARLFLN